MDKQIIIQQTCEFVKNELVHAEAGHDWSHIERVSSWWNKIYSTLTSKQIIRVLISKKGWCVCLKTSR